METCWFKGCNSSEEENGKWALRIKKLQRFHIKRNNIKKKKVDGCFFYGAAGHKKKQCTNYHVWRAKKGTLLNLVYYEVNLTSVPKHTWWIDSGATTHISVFMQGSLSCRKPNDGERYIFVGDGKKVEVEAIEIFRLLLKSGTYLDLNETFVVPSFRDINPSGVSMLICVLLFRGVTSFEPIDLLRFRHI